MIAIKQEIQKRKQTKQNYLQMLYDLEQSKWKKVRQQMNWMSDTAVNKSEMNLKQKMKLTKWSKNKENYAKKCNSIWAAITEKNVKRMCKTKQRIKH